MNLMIKGHYIIQQSKKDFPLLSESHVDINISYKLLRHDTCTCSCINIFYETLNSAITGKEHE